MKSNESCHPGDRHVFKCGKAARSEGSQTRLRTCAILRPCRWLRQRQGLRMTGQVGMLCLLVIFSYLAGCTVKAVGDPNRPITINANIVVDIRGLKKTAVGIEDMVAQGA